VIFKISFSIIPGNILGLQENHILFIGGSQGSANTSNQTRYAAKSNHEICPSAILILAIQALGRAFKTSTIVGVAAYYHCTKNFNSNFLTHYATYDLLWMANGADFNGKFYSFSSNLYEKDTDLIKRSHRSRTRRKRYYKSQIMNTMIYNISQSFPFKSLKSKKAFLNANFKPLIQTEIKPFQPRRHVLDCIVFDLKKEPHRVF